MRRLLIVLLLTRAVMAVSPARVPKVIATSPASDATAWISHQLFQEGSVVESSDAPCEKSVGRVLEQAGSYDSLRDLTLHAHAVFAGTVVATDQGFLYGQPGTLIAVAVTGVAKGDVKPDDIVLIATAATVPGRSEAGR